MKTAKRLIEQSSNDLYSTRPPSPCSSLPSRSCPFLVIFHGEINQWHTFLNISRKRYCTKSIPELRNKYVYTCPYNGWMVLRSPGSVDCFLLNLASMEKIQLPVVDFTFGDVFLTSLPNSPDCRVLFLNYRDNTLRVCQPTGGDGLFYKKELRHDEVLIIVITINKNVYGLTELDSLVTVEFEGPVVARITELIPSKRFPPSPPHVEYDKNYLIEICGEIFCIQKQYLEKFTGEVYDFVIYKADLSDIVKWVQVEDIGAKTIFLHDTSGCICISHPATESGIKNNSIYYIEDNKNTIYVWSLKDKTSSMHSSSCPMVRKVEYTNLYWFMMPAAYD